MFFKNLDTAQYLANVSAKIFAFKYIFFVWVFFAGCANNAPHYISQRDPIPTMGETKVNPEEEVVLPGEEPKELFVRQKDLKIRRKNPINQTGSLTDLNDPRAYLFGFERPVVVGAFIEVKIASNRTDNSPASNSSSADGAKAETEKDGVKSEVKAADEASLLKALPNLDPAGKDKPVLVKAIKMKVLERFENGDALVMYRRRSVRAGQGEEISVTAKVTADALTRLEQVTTADLEDVEYRESTKGEIVERKSANWEDEYSLRLSGFDETKSKTALELEDKRERLKDARDKLEAEMKALATERSTMAKERANLLDEKSKDNAKIADLENKTSELQQKVDELTPKEEKEAEVKSEEKDDTKKVAKDETAKDAKKSDAKAVAKEKPATKKDEKTKTAAKEKSAPKAEQAKAKDSKKPEPKDAGKKG